MPQMIAAARAHLTAIKSAERGGRFADLQTAKTAFYNVLFDHTGNQPLAALLKQLRARCSLTRANDRLRMQRMAESRRGAEEIFDAIRSKDAATAAATAVGHLQRASALAIAAMHRAEDRPAAKRA